MLKNKNPVQAIWNDHLVNMKLTTIETTIRALYFQLILLLGTGIVGMGHHYYVYASQINKQSGTTSNAEKQEPSASHME
jgi:hypothetical protein